MLIRWARSVSQVWPRIYEAVEVDKPGVERMRKLAKQVQLAAATTTDLDGVR